MMFLRFRVVSMVLACCLVAAHAEAQGTTDLEEAKAAFLEGVTATEVGNWTKAAELFKRSYDLSRRESALLNYAVSLSELRRYVEARAALDSLLREHDPTPEQRERAQVLLDDVGQKVAVLDLRGMERDVTHEIQVNGRKIEDEGRRPMRIDENPGPIDLEVRIPDAEAAFEWKGDAPAGERIRIDVELPDADDSSVLDSPWFWVATGTVVAAGIAVGLFFILDAGADLEPESGSTVNVDI